MNMTNFFFFLKKDEDQTFKFHNPITITNDFFQPSFQPSYHIKKKCAFATRPNVDS